jgi:multisubunit Na+/H+ antiporter MnhB subunit
MRRILIFLSALLLSGTVFFAIVAEPPKREAAPIVGRIKESAPRETGATNLVSAIYLGYRAYDTLGEALVLLLAVTGVYFFARDEEE